MTLKVFECFAGIGSQRMALRNINADFEIVGISEVDKWALLGYDAIHNNENHNFSYPSKEEMLKEFENKHIGYNFSTGKNEIPKKIEDIKKLYKAHIESKNFGDICLINEKNLPDFDLFTYSFPCKNISVAGQQEGMEENSGTQSSLVWECKRIIKEKKPIFLLMENVKNIVGKNHKDFFNKWCKSLEDIGYVNYWSILNGKNFKVPQNRERVIMISIRNDENIKFKMPQGSICNIRVEDILENNVDEKYYYKDEEVCLNENFHSIISNTKENKLIQIGMLNKKGNESNRRLYSVKGLCPTINSMNGGGRQPKFVENNFKVRKATELECWRLMGFTDDDFYKAKNIGKLPSSKLYERAGRGIVVPMLEEIFKALLK